MHQNDQGIDAASMAELKRAKRQIEAMHWLDYVSSWCAAPVTCLGSHLPVEYQAQVAQFVDRAMAAYLHCALYTVDFAERGTQKGVHIGAGVATGVIGGLLGVAALPVEINLVTLLTLRQIAKTAASEGEDLHQPEARLECLNVLAIVGCGSDAGEAQMARNYYEMRAAVEPAARILAARVVKGSASAEGIEKLVLKLAEKIATRWGVKLAELSAASIVPVFSSVMAGTLNGAFIARYQDLAHGHFTVRRLEREWGVNTIRRIYLQLSI